jgi:hypothetical protein
MAGAHRRHRIVVALATLAVRARTGSRCLVGTWALDLDRLVQEASVTQKLMPSGSVELKFHNGEFSQSYADTLTGLSTGATGTTIKVTQEYGGAVGGSYHTTGSAQLDLTDIVDTTSMTVTVTVNGVAGPPNTQSPAPGTQTAAVTLAYNCRGNALQMTAGGAVAQHYTRTH